MFASSPERGSFFRGVLALSVKPCRACQLSQRESPWHKDEVCMDCQSLSLWERWHHESDDGEGENADLYAFSLRNFSMKSTSLSMPSAGIAL